MDYVDVLELLRLLGGSIRGVTVYGYVREELPRPSNIFSNVSVEDNCTFRRMSCFAMDLSCCKTKLKELGVSSTTVFVHGDICILADKDLEYPDWYMVTGTLRYGSKTSSSYVTLLDYRKVRNNWHLAKNNLRDFEAYEVFPNSLIDAVIGGKGLPPEIDNLPAMQAVQTIHELDKQFDMSLPIASNTNSMQNSGVTTKLSRKELKEYNEVAKEFQRYLDEANYKLDTFKEQVENKYNIYENNDYIAQLCVNLKSNFKTKKSQHCFTGQALVKKYLQSFGSLAKGKYEKVPVIEYLLNRFNDVSDYVLYGNIPSFNGKAWELCKTAFGDADKMYAGILGALTDIDFSSTVNKLTDKNISFSKVVNNNPYLLSILGFVSISDSFYLGVLFGKHTESNLEHIRNVCLLYDYTLHSRGNSTVYKLDSIKGLGTKDVFVPMYAQESVPTFFTNRVVRRYDTTNWSTVMGKKVEVMSRSQLESALNDFIELGLGVRLNNYFTASIFLKQELYIYERLYEDKLEPLDISDEDIDKCIDEYENMLGFKLEPEQREGVHLIKYPMSCLSGSAGSGKTTTVGCIVYVLEKLCSDISIDFGSPTGKAAKVLNSVVKRPVKTLNSLCKIGIDEDDLYYSDEDAGSSSDSFYVFDEMSMVGVSLLYKTLKKLSNSRFMFVGDISQLKSISKGTIFKTLLSFLPCVYLKVSKRSAESSGITYNSNIINEKPNEELKVTDDFKFIQCSDDNIAFAVEDICSYLLGKNSFNKYNLSKLDITADDIQVISPITKATYSWGTYKLNQRLQPLFNQQTCAEDVIYLGKNKFIKGDRVIHTKTNSYGMQWYSSYKDNTYQKIYGNSVVNGDVGKLMGVFSADIATFMTEEEDKPVDFKYPDTIRDDSSYNGKNKYFIVVEYYDIAEDRPFYALYRCVKQDDGSFKGTDTSLLEPFYAGSTHKMQGSQAKVAICCLGSVSFEGFITRNMLYTMVTRGSELVVLIGSKSQIDKARKTMDCEDTYTVGNLLE